MNATETLSSCIGCKMIEPEQFIPALDNYIAERFNLSVREVSHDQLAAARAVERARCKDQCEYVRCSPNSRSVMFFDRFAGGALSRCDTARVTAIGLDLP